MNNKTFYDSIDRLNNRGSNTGKSAGMIVKKITDYTLYYVSLTFLGACVWLSGLLSGIKKVIHR